MHYIRQHQKDTHQIGFRMNTKNLQRNQKYISKLQFPQLTKVMEYELHV